MTKESALEAEAESAQAVRDQGHRIGHVRQDRGEVRVDRPAHLVLEMVPDAYQPVWRPIDIFRSVLWPSVKPLPTLTQALLCSNGAFWRVGVSRRCVFESHDQESTDEGSTKQS
eukprot:CAMPEP_0114554044 /NCGR_PEP_ID=MMETSP0114-20121206/7996_1 /TAXON_ID=31324 /ORGANISM="Goniomonas sp, Strain m" /LENGTH=113 /DNA_ID=CAMNT_0001739057 /DNA_START=1004 /DNA_END=1346 /DNA_ORIENTATION=+